MAKSKKRVEMMLRNVRGSYVYLAKPNDDGKRGMQIILDKVEHADLIAEIKQGINEIRQEVFQGAKIKHPLRYPEVEAESDGVECEPHLVGKVFMNGGVGPVGVTLVKSSGGKKVKCTQEEAEELFYSGAYYYVQIKLYDFHPKDTSNQKGVAVGINAVLFAGHGERLDGISEVDAEATFGGIEVGDADDADDADDEWDDDTPY